MLVISAHTNQPFDVGFLLAGTDPSADVWGQIVAPSGSSRRVPAFARGGQSWTVRCSSDEVGEHQMTLEAGDTAGEAHLATIIVDPYEGPNPLFRHGGLRVAPDGRHLAHIDGSPFFWLGDTWWFAATARFTWPEIFAELTADRLRKGFTVVQLVAGLPPEITDLGPISDNEGGAAWIDGSGVNPAFYDHLDIKIDFLVRSGLVPCIFAAWGYYLPQVGVEGMKQYWRNLVARYAAYPVVWSYAGEGDLPPYRQALAAGDLGSSDLRDAARELVKGWAEVAAYVREIDPYSRLTTIHPCPVFSYRSTQILDGSLIDIDMLQTGHTDRHCLESTLRALQDALAAGQRPVLNGEVCYEGIFGANWAETQRFLFWTHMLGGAAGHTYGTFGISTFSGEGDDRYAGVTQCSDHTWRECMNFLGSAHVGLGKRLLESLPWHEFEPHPEWITPHWTDDDHLLPYAAGFPDIRVFYIPGMTFIDPHGGIADWPTVLKHITLNELETGVAYRARYINPRTGEPTEPFQIRSSDGTAKLDAGMSVTATPTGEDWVLLLERT
jgi:hypothetical protein